MATRLMLVLNGQEEGKSAYLLVRDDFDAVLNKLLPLQGEGSALEARENCTYTDTEGNRVFVPRSHVGFAEENYSDDS